MTAASPAAGTDLEGHTAGSKLGGKQSAPGILLSGAFSCPLGPSPAPCTSLRSSDPPQQASPQQKFKASSPSCTGQKLQPRSFEGTASAGADGGKGGKAAASVCNAWHPNAGSETAKSAAVEPNPGQRGGEQQRES